jgi:hypothetical protein
MATIQTERSALAEHTSLQPPGTPDGNPLSVEDVLESSVNFLHVRDPEKFSLELLIAMRTLHHLHILFAALEQSLNPSFFHDPLFNLYLLWIDLNAIEYALFLAFGFLFGFS